MKVKSSGKVEEKTPKLLAEERIDEFSLLATTRPSRIKRLDACRRDRSRESC